MKEIWLVTRVVRSLSQWNWQTLYEECWDTEFDSQEAALAALIKRTEVLEWGELYRIDGPFYKVGVENE